MKKSNIIVTGTAALVAIAAITGVAFSALAQRTTTSVNSTTANNAPGGRMGQWQNLTDEQKAEREAQMEAHRQEMETVRTAIKTAMSQGYQAWVTAVKKYNGETAQILDEVTADNFAKYVEASGYMEQARTYQEKARTILNEIGVHDGMGKGMGMGGGRGMGGFGGPHGQINNTGQAGASN